MPHFTRLSSIPSLTVIEAEQWFPGLAVAGVTDEAPGHAGSASLLAVPPHAFLASGRERVTVFASDWIITEESGRQHVCQPGLFAQNYVRLETAPPELEMATLPASVSSSGG